MNWQYWIGRPPASFDIRDEVILENVTFSKTDRVLEVGVGMAGTTYKLASQVAYVTAVDISPELIGYLAGRKGVPNIRFLTVDICAERAAHQLSGPFDKVVSEDTMEHVTDPLGFLRTVACVLRPGGLFALTFPNESPPSHGITRFQTLGELEALLRQAGFQSARFHTVELRWHARWLQAILADFPIRLLRAARTNPHHEPQVFHETWSFGVRNKLEPVRGLIHAYWGTVRSVVKIWRPVYRKEPAGQRILDRRLLVLATR